jgi:nitrous oxidase accessory protein NosD
VSGAVVAGSTFLAGSARITVAQDGSGMYATVTEAVAAANDGDTILVRPGRYAESVVIDKDIKLLGDGPPKDVAIEFDDAAPTFDGYWYGASPFGVLIEGSDAEVGNLTIRWVGTPESSGTAITVNGGQPSIHDVATEGESGSTVYIMGGSAARLTGNRFGGIVFVRGGGTATIADNTIRAHVIVENDVDMGPVVISGNELAGVTIAPNHTNWVGVAGPARIEGNRLRLPAGETDAPPSDFLGINVVNGEGWLVRENDVSGFTTGIDIRIGAAGVVERNVLSDNETGILIRGTRTEVLGNDVTGGTTGIRADVGSARLEGNTIEGAEVGLDVRATTGMTLSGNVFCGNATNLSLPDTSSLEIDESNRICEDAATIPPA